MLTHEIMSTKNNGIFLMKINLGAMEELDKSIFIK